MINKTSIKIVLSVLLSFIYSVLNYRGVLRDQTTYGCICFLITTLYP